jgi:AAA+ ATPase superfamily predicted ATPase
MDAAQSIGYLFPAGGPVPRKLILGRQGPIAELSRRIEERIHTILTGERRIGKTTVCNAVCGMLAEEGSTVVQVEVPESTDAEALLQLVIDRSRDRGPVAEGRRLFKAAAEPLIEAYLSEQGIPVDLSGLDHRPLPQTMRKILSLPIKLAEEDERAVVLYFDELQRVVDYRDGRELLGELVDLYSGRTDVVLLVDGSNERALEQMMVPPVGFGKLVDRLPLVEEIRRRSGETVFRRGSRKPACGSTVNPSGS